MNVLTKTLAATLITFPRQEIDMFYAVLTRPKLFARWADAGWRSYTRGSAETRAAELRALGIRAKVVIRDGVLDAS